MTFWPGQYGKVVEEIQCIIAAPYSYSVSQALKAKNLTFLDDCGCNFLDQSGLLTRVDIAKKLVESRQYYCTPDGLYIFSPFDAGLEVSIQFTVAPMDQVESLPTLEETGGGGGTSVGGGLFGGARTLSTYYASTTDPLTPLGLSFAGKFYSVGDEIQFQTLTFPGTGDNKGKIKSIDSSKQSLLIDIKGSDWTLTFQMLQDELETQFYVNELKEKQEEKEDWEPSPILLNPFKNAESYSKWLDKIQDGLDADSVPYPQKQRPIEDTVQATADAFHKAMVEAIKSADDDLNQKPVRKIRLE